MREAANRPRVALQPWGRTEMCKQRNILFLVIDTLRADMCFGEDRPVKTPTIDYLKSQGTSFTQAISVGSVTLTTVSSMLTGLYPFVHGVIANLADVEGLLEPLVLNPKCITLQEILRRSGYHTYAMVTGPLAEYVGLVRGFEEYSHRDWRRETIYTDWGGRLKETIRNRKLKEPWFLFLHLWDVHLPRVVPRSFNRYEYGRNRYERAISCLDHHLQELFDLLDFNETILLIHGDHGENLAFPPLLLRPLFFTKAGRFLNARVHILGKLRYLRRRFATPRLRNRTIGWVAHGDFLLDFLVRVPLIAIGKGIFPEGMIISSQISQVDILPTILDAVGLYDRLDQRIHGRSLMPFVEGKPFPDRPVYLETGRHVAIRTPEWKLIIDKSVPGTSELYNLEKDPVEECNLIGSEEEIALSLGRALREIRSLDFEELSSAPSEIAGGERREIERNLRDMGYL